MHDEVLAAKEQKLKDLLQGYNSLALAYSGGVDSTYLADVAHEVLGPRLGLVLFDTPSNPRAELAEAKALAEARGWNLCLLETHEFDDDDYLRNDPLRCYYCKTGLFHQMTRYAAENDLAYAAHGENADDAADATRVGHRAAQEQGIVAPLQEAGLHKAEIRELSRRRNLPTSDKPSMACLSTRVPTGTRLTVADLARIERAEAVLKGLRFRQYRVRHHGDLCRIELEPVELERAAAPDVRAAIVTALSALGYRHVTLDLAGYGSPADTLD